MTRQYLPQAPAPQHQPPRRGMTLETLDAVGNNSATPKEAISITSVRITEA